MKTNKLFIYIFTVLFFNNIYSQNETDLDNTFNTSSLTPLSNIININNKYLLLVYDGTDSILVRLNNDGSIDNTFNFSGNFYSSSGSYRCIEIQNDGKIVVAGPQYNNNAKTINRFNADGSSDTSFNFSQNLSQINAIKIQNDGKIIYGADNTGNFGRINSDGTEDTSFLTGSNIYHSNGSYVSVQAIEIDGNNKILIGGPYNRYNGNISNGMTRLNSDGSFDTSFNVGAGFNYDWEIVRDIEIQDDGKIIVGGGFTSFNNSYVPRIIRLNNDGTRDMTFNASVNNSVRDILIQPNGKIILGGVFTTVNGSVNKNRLCRFNIDGSVDNTFDILTGFDSPVTSIINDNNNKLLISGGFSSYQGITTNRIIRLFGPSVLSTNNSEIDKIVIFPNPVQEKIYFSNLKNVEYEIYNMLGKLVLKGNNVENEINVNNITKGVYILKLKKGEHIFNQKFIKE
jgi:uncharacterized delta-60 repeat protein